MKKLSKILAIVLSILMIAMTLAACNKPADTKDDVDTTPDTDTTITTPADVDTTETRTFKIGLCNFVDDASLNQIVENIQNQLVDFGLANNVVFSVTVENCNTDASLLQQIISEFKADEVDMMIGIATPVAMAMQAATEGTDIPVVFAAVSDPVAAGIVDSLESPGANITGTSDYLDTNAIFNLMTTLDTDIAKVGLLYDVGQDSSTTAINDAKAYLENAGIEYVEANGTTIEEITLAAQQLVSDGVEAVFTPSDNSIMAAELSIYEIFAEAGIPHYTGADSFALNGAFLGYGVDFANLGRKTADMAAEILFTGNAPAYYAVKTFDNGTATINTETAAAIGYNYDDLAALFGPLCTQVNPIETAESFN